MSRSTPSASYFIPPHSSSLQHHQSKKRVTFQDVSNSLQLQSQPKKQVQSQRVLRKYNTWNKGQENNNSTSFHSNPIKRNNKIPNSNSNPNANPNPNANASRLMNNLLQNKSLMLHVDELKVPVTKQATKLVKNKVREHQAGGEARKCQSEYKLKKYDYLGDREQLFHANYSEEQQVHAKPV